MGMAKRSYQQYCGIAAALDLLGERWTLLIVRDLLIGPKRFTDLLEGLPGVGTGLLSQRLRELEESGVIEKAALLPPAASTVYRLTPDGEGLRPAMLSLLRWGSRRLGNRTRSSASTSSRWLWASPRISIRTRPTVSRATTSWWSTVGHSVCESPTGTSMFAPRLWNVRVRLSRRIRRP